MSEGSHLVDPAKGNSLAVGGLDGNAASRRGANVDCADLGLVGTRTLLRVLFGASMILPFFLSKGLLRL